MWSSCSGCFSGAKGKALGSRLRWDNATNPGYRSAENPAIYTEECTSPYGFSRLLYINIYPYINEYIFTYEPIILDEQIGLYTASVPQRPNLADTAVTTLHFDVFAIGQFSSRETAPLPPTTISAHRTETLTKVEPSSFPN